LLHILQDEMIEMATVEIIDEGRNRREIQMDIKRFCFAF
jgi:hypothetical protein